MDIPDKSREPGEVQKKEIKQIVTAVKAPRPATRRIKDYLMAESPKDLAKKIARDIVVPRLKAGFEEAANSFLSGMLWGEGNRPVSNIVKGTVLRGGGTNYQQISSGPSALTQAREANQSRTSSGNYSDLLCPTQERAEFLLANLLETLGRYHVVAVGDLYEMAGITAQPSDNAYGWYSLDGARIMKERNGYRLMLPSPILV